MSGSALMVPRARAKYVGSRHVPVATVALPPPTKSLDLGAFTAVVQSTGAAELLGPRGDRCGLFVNEQLARQTADFLSQ